MRSTITQFALIAATLVATACGAPTKSAGDVASLFEGDSTSLQDKENGLCSALQARTEAPTTRGLSLNLVCGDAGAAALDYKKIGSANYSSGFYFKDSGASGGDTDDVLHKSMRAQVWLNRSLLGLAQAVTSKMKANEGLEGGGVLKFDDSKGGGMAGLANSKVTVLEKPAFDVEKLKFSMKINLDVTGIVTANHDILIDGQMIDNAFAVTVKTTVDKTYEESIIKSFNAVMLIIPHASDVYLDLFTDLYVYKPGLDAAVDENVTRFLSTGLKGAIDSLMVL